MYQCDILISPVELVGYEYSSGKYQFWNVNILEDKDFYLDLIGFGKSLPPTFYSETGLGEIGLWTRKTVLQANISGFHIDERC